MCRGQAASAGSGLVRQVGVSPRSIGWTLRRSSRGETDVADSVVARAGRRCDRSGEATDGEVAQQAASAGATGASSTTKRRLTEQLLSGGS